jgi:hypothetical protein
MSEIVARKLTEEKDGIPGYIAHPARTMSYALGQLDQPGGRLRRRMNHSE